MQNLIKLPNSEIWIEIFSYLINFVHQLLRLNSRSLPPTWLPTSFLWINIKPSPQTWSQTLMIIIINFDPRDNPVFLRPVLACKASEGLSKRVKTSRHLYFKWVIFIITMMMIVMYSMKSWLLPNLILLSGKSWCYEIYRAGNRKQLQTHKRVNLVFNLIAIYHDEIPCHVVFANFVAFSMWVNPTIQR